MVTMLSARLSLGINDTTDRFSVLLDYTERGVYKTTYSALYCNCVLDPKLFGYKCLKVKIQFVDLRDGGGGMGMGGGGVERNQSSLKHFYHQQT